jgi:F0F1-type ATP synthase membrane subunit b/b'
MNNEFVRRFFNANEPEQTTPGVAMSKSDEGEMGTGDSGRDRPEPADYVYDEVGDQVSAILAAAKQAAHQLRESARKDAERMRKEAENQATVSLEQAGRDAARTRTEGDHVRAEAEAYSKSTREAADRDAAETRRTIREEAEKLLTEAKHEANAIRHAARRRSDELRTEAMDRQQALIGEAGRSEARLQQLLDVFRAMTSQLEDLLEPEPGGKRRTMQSEDAASAEELDEALRPHALRDSST